MDWCYMSNLHLQQMMWTSSRSLQPAMLASPVEHWASETKAKLHACSSNENKT